MPQTGTAKTIAQLNAEIASLLPDQHVGSITPQNHRQLELDIVASMPTIGGGGLTNINTLASFYTDGVTSNVPSFQALLPLLQSVNSEFPIPVNITIGNPTVLSINPTVVSGGTQSNPVNHFLKPNQAFHFKLSAGGSLPAGIDLTTTYYIRAGTQGVDGITATTFTFSTTNNYGLLPSNVFTSEGSGVATSGSLTGTLSIVLTGRSVSLFIPPGPYFGDNYGSPTQNVNVTPNGMTLVRYFAYDAIFDTKTSFGVQSGPTACLRDARDWSFLAADLITTTNTNTNPANVDALVTLITTAAAANYYVGGWVSIYGLNVQDAYNNPTSAPPNMQFHEYKQIKAINTGTGVITFDGPLKYVYLSTFPELFTPSAPAIFPAGGAAAMIPMHPAWDCEVQIHGARWYGQPVVTSARRVLYNDCTFQGYANQSAEVSPSVAETFVYRNCRFGPEGIPGVDFAEVDKMIEYLEIDGSSGYNKYRIQFTSPSPRNCLIRGYHGAQILGTGRNLTVLGSKLDSIQVGSFIGTTDTCTIQNTPVTFFDMLARTDDPIDLVTLGVNLAPSNDMTLVPNWTFSNGTFTRDLSTAGGAQGMTWQVPGAKMYFIDAGGVYSAGQNMGSPFTILNASNSGSSFSFDTTLTAIPTRQTSHTATITIASPGVVTWTSHGLPAGTPVVFTTTGTLPTGLSKSTPYYVTNDGNLAANTFAVSSTRSGALAGTGQINTSGSQSGTHTAWGNPLCFRIHPCPRFTGIGNTGCNNLIDQNSLIDEPLFSRIKRAFVGRQSNLGGNSIGNQQPNPRIWGYLKSMTVNVRKAGTASGTITFSCPGFTQPNLTLSNFSQVIDTTVAGVRSWTGSGAPTGSAGADSIASYADWISGPMVFTWSTGVTLPNSPVVEVEILTDQGITRFGNMMGGPSNLGSGTTLWQYADAGLVQV